MDTRDTKTDTKESLIQALNNSNTLPPLFCIHPVGGQVVYYQQLADKLKNHFHVYAIRSPGLYGECEPLDNIQEMAALYFQAVKKIEVNGPYYFLGWSMGGLIAYELAQLAIADNQKAIPILLDTDDPTTTPKIAEMDKNTVFKNLTEMQAIGVHYVESGYVSWRVRLSLAMLKIVGLSFQKTAFLTPLMGVNPCGLDFSHFEEHLQKMIHDVSTREPTQYELDRWIVFLRTNKLISEQVKDQTLKNFYNVFRANFYAAEHYNPKKFAGEMLYVKASKRQFKADWQTDVSHYKQIIVNGNHYILLSNATILQAISNFIIHELSTQQEI